MIRRLQNIGGVFNVMAHYPSLYYHDFHARVNYLELLAEDFSYARM